MDHIDRAAEVLESYGLDPRAAMDAACDVLQASTKEKVKEYEVRAWDNDISATERATLFIRIDTLKKFAELKGKDDQSNYNVGYSQAIADWNLGNRPPIKFQMRHFQGDVYADGYLTAWHLLNGLIKD